MLRRVAVATGFVDSWLHIPRTARGHVFPCWEYASGSLLIEEACGKATDATGKPLDLKIFRKPIENFGLAIAARGNASWTLVDAIAERCGQDSFDSAQSSSDSYRTGFSNFKQCINLE